VEGLGGCPRVIEDIWRELKEEWLVATMVENIYDAMQTEAACLLEELEGMGHSLALLVSCQKWPAQRSALTPFILVGAASRRRLSTYGPASSPGCGASCVFPDNRGNLSSMCHFQLVS
jgi:hypothetical protein